jgi:pimeloyl-ACP methyl ester carboxylesterase
MGEIKSNSVVSEDGTTIEYLTCGTGPSIILVPGTLSIANDLVPLAEELATQFTVHIINRRGRGGSGPQIGTTYSISKECQDIHAVYLETQSSFLFGHSYGGFVVLETAMRYHQDMIKKIVLYEPGMSVDGSIDITLWKERSEKEVLEGMSNEAFVTFVQGSNPDTTGRLPRWLLKLIFWMVMNPEELQQKYNLMPTTIREHMELVKRNDMYREYAGIEAKVCVLYGNDEKAERVAMKLESTLKDVVRLKYPKLDHFGPEKMPKEIAETVKGFYYRGEEIVRE